MLEWFCHESHGGQIAGTRTKIINKKKNIKSLPTARV